MSPSRTISLLTIVALALTLLPLATTPEAAHAAEPRLVRAGELGPSSSTALGDLDSDGDLDTVLQVDASGLHVRRNTGSGDFGAAQVLTVEGGAAGRPILADLDGDGDLDIVSGRTLFRNSGSSFSGQTLPIAGSVADAGDFTGDGAIDLVVEEAGQPYRLYRNMGDGTFGTSTALQGTESASGGFDIGDVNGDGALDLVFGDLQLFFTDGSGAVSHTARLQFPEGFFGPGVDVRLGDVNGDEVLDVVVRSFGELVVGINSGAGLFNPLTQVADAHLVWSFELGDIDNDGDNDIVAGEQCVHRCQLYGHRALYLNDGAGSFSLGPELGLLDNSMEHVSLGDLDGDHDLEAVFSNSRTLVYRNLSAGGFSRSIGVTNYSSPGMALGDMNGDLSLDVVLGSTIYIHTGGKRYGSNGGFSTNGNRPTLGDLDGDGDLDMIAGKNVFLNDGDAMLTPFATLHSDADGAPLGDVDGDGDLDSIIWGGLYLNDGAGRLSYHTTLLPPAGPAAALGDLDRDGDLDAIVMAAQTQAQVLLNDGSGALAAYGQPLASEGIISRILVGDLDANGSLDAIVGGSGCPDNRPCSAKHLVFLNDGTGALVRSSAVRPQGAYTPDFALGDVDGDHDLDVILASNFEFPHGGEPGGVYLNDGRGAFSLGQTLSPALPESSQQVALGDMDGDGDLDLVRSMRGFERTETEILFNTLPQVTPSSTGAAALVTSRPAPDQRGGTLAFATVHTGPVIEIPFSATDPEGNPLRQVRASYSLDGGVVWSEAVPAAGARLTNLPTLRERYQPTLPAPLPIPDLGSASSTLTVPTVASARPVRVTDLKVRLNVEHAAVSDLRATLRGPNGASANLFHSIGGDGDNILGLVLDEDAPLALNEGAAPFTGRYRPFMGMYQFRGASPFGEWTLEIADEAGGNVGRLISWSLELTTNGVGHVFPWDLAASRVTGFSDNVVVRIEAEGGGAGSFGHAASTSTSDPFRVRGLQPRAVDAAGRPVAGALVYRLPARQEFGATPIPAQQPGRPQLTTDANGYLQGRPELAVGDRLVALRPIGGDATVRRFHTSAAPTPDGLAMHTVQQFGVQPLVVRASQPLMLLDLEVSLEWDARRDAQFLSQLERELKRASDLLFDWSDGQVALGAITVHHSRARWDDAHIRIYASNRVRPNAVKGGIVGAERSDPSPAVTDSYLPGQIRMGSVWNRFGEATSALSDDWARAFAHEVGHFALFLDDNYLGFDSAGRLVSSDLCPGAMTDPYREDFSEFHPDGGWGGRCANTLSQRTSGRSDWATIKAFYDDAGFRFNAPATFNTQPGPQRLPLGLTTVRYAEPAGEAGAIDPPIFLLTNQQGGLLSPLPGRGARAFLFQSRGDAQGGDRLVDLGRPVVDQVNARGAAAGDRVCLIELDRQRLGCRAVDAPNQQIRLGPVSDWRPDIRLTPVTSATLELEVRGLAPGLALRARLYPGSGPASAEAALAAVSTGYRLRIERPASAPAFEGLLHLWIEEPGQRRETVVDFRTGGNPGKGWARTAPRSNPGKGWARTAPVLSSDGQAIIFTPDGSIGEGQFFTLMASDSPPPPPAWATPVSRAYRLSSTPGVSFAQLSLNIGYMGDEVPGPQEANIITYYWNEGLTPPRWEALEAHLDPDRNEAAAAISRPGIYQLMTSLAVPLDRAGWNLVPAYPGATQPLAEALGGSAGRYTTVYGYEAGRAGSPWQLFDVDVPPWVNDLDQLRANESYWVRATRPTSLLVRSASLAGAGPAQSLTLPPPPATYYGELPADLAGAEVVATIGRAVCGRSTARSEGDGAVFVVHVEAAGVDQLAGCGGSGKQVVVAVGELRFTAPWRNDRPQPLTPGLAAPGPDIFVYLPAVQR